MSIANTDLKAVQSANMPETDAVTSGGAIAPAGSVEFTDIAATDVVDYVSDGADTRNVTVTGRDATGAIVSETKTLNGATPVLGTQNFERILKVVTTSDAARTFTLKRHTGLVVIATIAPLITSTRRLFYDSASQAAQTIRYEKIFWKNTHGSLTLNQAAMKLTADPSAKIRIGCAPSIDDSASVANRLTAPSSVTFVDDNVSQNVPGGVLPAGSAIGVWIEMTLAANDSPVKSSLTTQLAGTTV